MKGWGGGEGYGYDSLCQGSLCLLSCYDVNIGKPCKGDVAGDSINNYQIVWLVAKLGPPCPGWCVGRLDVVSVASHSCCFSLWFVGIHGVISALPCVFA